MTPVDLRSAALTAIEDSEFATAEHYLREYLEDDPHDAPTTAVLALCVAELGRLEEAEQLAARAVTLEPYLSYPHWVHGGLLLRARRVEEAHAAALEALRLEPDDADHHALEAQVHGVRANWRETLAAAERGLAIEPGHATSANLRAMALRQLGRTAEAEQAFAEAAMANPLNTFAMAGKGWSDLAHGRTVDADGAFRDALLFDPTSEWAREGLLATLKSRSPIYRQLLRYFIWMSGRSSRERTMFAIGGVLGYNFLRRIARGQPDLAPVIWPVLIAYALFVVLTWLADPILDLMLSFDREGRRLLSRDRLRGGYVVGACLALAVLLGLGGLTGLGASLGLAGFGLAFIALPLAGVYQCEPGWPRVAMAGYVAALVALLTVGTTIDGGVGGSLFALAIVGAVLGTWLARWLTSVTPGRPSRNG